MVITIVVPQENLSELDTSAAKQNQNLQHAIGRAKLSGPDQGDQPKVHPKIGKENISIFVFII